jgi:hypothetical protein
LQKSWQKVVKKLVKILKWVGVGEEEGGGGKEEEGDLRLAPRPGTTLSHLVKNGL